LRHVPEGSIPFGNVFLLNITYGKSFLSSAVMDNITVHHNSLVAVVLTGILDVPFSSMVVFLGMSKKIGVW
jgi:hypothetical protein